jgi:hypothetical protein
MLAFKHNLDLFADVALPKHELLEVHRSKISLHRAKSGYGYPMIRLPVHFQSLPGYLRESTRQSMKVRLHFSSLLRLLA